ncbi:MAG: hypothetical protein F4185_07005 [Chloroflexi bacterium]|nr:hypothetical protein [Chloroflexota bacterium]MYF65613.1 hypothetical protein [Chloroflexota bacterium]
MPAARPASSPSPSSDPTTADPGATKFGEVVEASVDSVTGQCHTLYGAPPLGTLVRVGASLFAVVDGVSTAALDPGRRVIARGAGLESESDVYAENPQLERLLRTDVTLTVVGHEEGGRYFQHLPPLPPRIHTFLYACSGAEVRGFMERSDWTALVLASALPTADDVLAAALREAAPHFDAPRAFLMQTCRAIASQLPTDAARLAAIMRRLPLSEDS